MRRVRIRPREVIPSLRHHLAQIDQLLPTVVPFHPAHACVGHRGVGARDAGRRFRSRPRLICASTPAGEVFPRLVVGRQTGRADWLAWMVVAGARLVVSVLMFVCVGGGGGGSSREILLGPRPVGARHVGLGAECGGGLCVGMSVRGPDRGGLSALRRNGVVGVVGMEGLFWVQDFLKGIHFVL